MSNKVRAIDPNPLDAETLLKIQGLEKIFLQGENRLTIFKNLNMKIERGEIVALVGPSGAGKSTLLQIAGLLDQPTAGRITVDNQDVTNLNDRERTHLRRDYIGFVYQFHHLLAEFSALENVIMPQIIAGQSWDKAAVRAKEVLTDLGLKDRLDHRPARLSGGEQQRVAIARALANDPQLIFADEPTGNLDSDTADEVFEVLLEQVNARKIGALIATHNMHLADKMDRILEMKGGQLLAY